MAESLRESNVDLMSDDDASDQEEGATGGGPAGTPETGVEVGITVPATTAAASGPTTTTTAAPSLSLSPFLSSSRGGGGGGGLDRDPSGRRRSPEGNRRELEEAYRRIAQQDAMIDEFQRRLRELEERFREVRERPDEGLGWETRGPIRTRAADHTEVSGRFIHPGHGEPVTSTPLRPVGLDLEDRPPMAVPTAMQATSTSHEYQGGAGWGGGHGLAVSSAMPATSPSPSRQVGLGLGDRPPMAVPTAMQATSTSHEYQGGAGWGEGHGQAVSSATPATSPSPVTPGGNGKVTSSDSGVSSLGGGGGGLRGPLVRIGEYDGESDLTAFLGRFERMAQLYKWPESEQIIFLETSLKGAAADIVYEVQPTTTIEEMKEMLRVRFGTEKQGEVSRTELHHTRRQPGEPLQKLYRTIKKLMSVGYPGPPTAMRNWIGRDHFLRALHDDPFSVQVSLQKPQTLEEALTAALELEALGVGREGERLRKETQTRSGQCDWTRSQHASRPGFDHQVERTVPALRQRDVDMLVRAIYSWTELMVEEPPSPTDTGQDYSWDSD